MISKETVSIGEVVYYIKRNGNVWYPWFGTVHEFWHDCVQIKMWNLKDTCRINGIPKVEFKTPTKWQKLPKGWSYDTRLFEKTWDAIDWKDHSKFITDKENLKGCMDDGILVPSSELDWSKIETEIESRKGWRIVRRYDSEYHPDTISKQYNEVWKTYDEAKKICDERKAELKREANLSDYDWSVEQIDRTLDKWNRMYGTDGETEKKKIRDFILSREKVEDIEVRIFSKRIQWRYWKNKRWNFVEV